MEKEIVIKPNFVFKDCFKINLYMIYRKPFVKIIISIIFFIIIFSAFANFSSNNKEEIFESLKPAYIFSVLYPSFLIFTIYRSTKKSLVNPKLKEDIIIRFKKEYFEETGQTFSVKYSWSEIFKIIEKKEWFLIFLEKNKALPIIKTDLKDNQYIEIKELFNSLNVKKSLK
jgi:hypothetical protein